MQAKDAKVGKDGELVIASNEIIQLKSDYNYEFTKVIITNGTLTVNDWDSTAMTGGRLLIKSLNQVLIGENGRISLNGKGYRGGNDTYCGESYNHPSTKKGAHNLGGGGGSGWSCFAGGGGYGTSGSTNSYEWSKYDNGGVTYGDKLLTILHLGSGGGGASSKSLSHGGGALKIECDKFINNGIIEANGITPKSQYSGGGSGGSIFIICNEFVMNSNTCSKNNFIKTNIIYAIGGRNFYQTGSHGGDGGNGRIRIKALNNLSSVINCVLAGQINPQPYIDINEILTYGYVRDACKSFSIKSLPNDLIKVIAIHYEISIFPNT